MALTLLHSPADVAAFALGQGGVGSLPDSGDPWPVYAYGRATELDDVILVTDTEGTGDGRDQHTGEAYCHYGLQVSARSSRAVTGSVKATAAREFMTKSGRGLVVAASDPTASYLLSFTTVGQVIPAGRERTSARQLFTVNATCVVQRLS